MLELTISFFFSFSPLLLTATRARQMTSAALTFAYDSASVSIDRSLSYLFQITIFYIVLKPAASDCQSPVNFVGDCFVCDSG